MKNFTIALCAGEASGDKLGAQLVRQLRRRLPQATFYGIGGAQMEAAGVELVADYQPLAVMGYRDALLSLPAIWRVRQRFIKHVQLVKPDLFIGIDAPDFNLPLARRLRKSAIRCIQYVMPSVWMWRRARLKKISAAADGVLCLLPFEKALFAGSKTAVYYVGHPAAQREFPRREEARQRLGIAAEQEVVALLPGSRRNELQQHLPLLQQVVARLGDDGGRRRFVSALPDDEMTAQLKQLLPQAVCGALDDVLAAADIAIVKSGTAVLEAALAQVPLLMFYRLPWLGRWLLYWRKFYLPYFSLPNILSRRFVVTELLLEEATAENIAREGERLLTDSERRAQQQRQFKAVRAMLAADICAADAVVDFIAKNQQEILIK